MASRLLYFSFCCMNVALGSGISVSRVRHDGEHILNGAKNLLPLEGDPCFELEQLGSHYVANSEHMSSIAEAYRSILSTCSTGIHNLACITKARFANKPMEWLRLCNQQLGPQPVASGAVCLVAQRVRDEVSSESDKYRRLSTMIDSARDGCSSVPLACIIHANQCLNQFDIRFCFNQCLRTGNMEHAMMGSMQPPKTLASTTTTTTSTTSTTTTTTTSKTNWWDAIVATVEDTAGVEIE
mmetsp:Transcript_16267/g.41377  ORF Transcript_16267/g.41377 Transcript_16267/m.41377 type:complete len:240 (-) Transcript_16267:49-768(-)